MAQRRGSGVFVSTTHVPQTEDTVEAFAQGCLEDGLARGFTRSALLDAFATIGPNHIIHHILVVDPDAEFARVLAAEIGEATGIPVTSDSFANMSGLVESGTCVIVNSAHHQQGAALAGQAPVRCVELKSMQDVVAGIQRPVLPVLIGVVSRSESILRWSSTLLSALGFSRDSVILRDPKQPHWKDGLAACDIVATDLVSAVELSSTGKPIIFRLISERFLVDLRQSVTLV